MKAIGYVMKAIGYVRVSTDRQAEQGVSLEAQQAKIRAIATVQGADSLEVIIDGGGIGQEPEPSQPEAFNRPSG
jgi:DNA invertase Pin-like site-specific DNA recombinase